MDRDWIALLLVSASLACGASTRSDDLSTTDGIELESSTGEDADRATDGGSVRIDLGIPGAPVRPVVLADPPPPPISGGTMQVSTDGDRVYASDPARDLFYVVDRSSRSLTHIVELESGCEPGRVTEDEAAMVHVACRRSGDIVTIDPVDGEIADTRWACHNPRGLMSDSLDGSILVTCAEGVLVTLHMDGVRDAVDLGVELRDIVALQPELRVSTFRVPAVLTLDPEGNVIEERRPSAFVSLADGLAGLPPDAEDGDGLVESSRLPNTSRRTRTFTDGGWAMLHQLGFMHGFEGGLPDQGWGDCTLLQESAISYWTPDLPAPHTSFLRAMPVAYDFDVSADGQRVAVVGMGLVAFQTPGLVSPTVVAPCEPFDNVRVEGDPTAVAFDADGMAWVQLREPAGFAIVDPVAREVVAEIPLGVESVADTGHTLFHEPTGALVACVSCHPEGREDGLRWALEAPGFRRSQSLATSLEGSEPFHWRGDMDSIHEIFHDVRVEVMRGAPLNTAHAAALERWIFSIPPMNPAPPDDADAIARGEAKFVEVGCAACHSGPRLSNEQNVAMAQYGELQVPTLIGIRYRAPYMHDARSENLHEAVLDMLAFSEPGGPASLADLDDIVTYLQSL